VVDSLVFNDFDKRIDSFRTEFKDVVGEEFVDIQGRKSFLMKRYIRKNETQSWVEKLSFYVTSTNLNVEQVEDNLRFIKMVFPVKPNVKWLGNAYISTQFNPELQWLNNKNWIYRYQDLSKPFSTGFINFDSTASIQQVNDYTGDSISINNYSDLTFGKEVYAKHVGLIYKQIIYWVYQVNIKYRKGFSVTYRAKAHN
jgi:hypothetical protein